jgi:hypothetical protein
MGKYKTFGSLFNRIYRNDLNQNFVDIEADINAQKTRVDNIVASAGSSNTEIVDARGGKTVLKDRLDGVDASLVDSATTLGIELEKYKRQGVEATDTERINRALTALSSAGGGRLILAPYKTYVTTGNHEIPSNVAIVGNRSVFQLVQNTIACVFKNLSATGYTNITLSGIVIDGNCNLLDTQMSQAENHALFMRNVTGLTLLDIEIRNPVAWCSKIHKSTKILVSNFRAFSTQPQQDGLHFVDCSEVLGVNIYGETGDDMLGITCDEWAEMKNLTFVNVQGKSEIASLIRLNQSNYSVSQAQSVTMKHMKFLNVNGWDCRNRGFSFADVHTSSFVEDITLQGSFRNISREAVRMVMGYRCNIDVTVDTAGTGLNLHDGTTVKSDSVIFNRIDHSTIKAKIKNVADGFSGVNVQYGTHNEVAVDCEYVTTGKTSLKYGLEVGFVNYSHFINGNFLGGDAGIKIGDDTAASGGIYNIVSGNTFKDMTTYAIMERGISDNNYIHDNLAVTKLISKIAANTKVKRNRGHITENEGTATIASGATSVVVNHGLYASPSIVTPSGRDSDTGNIWADTFTATQFTIRVPAAVGGARIVMWEAKTL